MNSKPRIAVTTGDPAGIGPEICVKLLTGKPISEHCIPIVVGDYVSLQIAASGCGCDLSRVNIVGPLGCDPTTISEPTIVDLNTTGIAEIEPGSESAAAGRAAWSYIDQAIEWSLRGSVDAVTTGPINKRSMSLAGITFPGHTEIFASKTNTTRYCMLQHSEEITCAFVTTHVGYADVLRQLNCERIYDVIELAATAVQRLNDRKPKLLVCGLNPHAGEQGLFGNLEEERIIQPAIDRAINRGIDVVGPYPPDTCFIPANRASTDCFICMYHDQGHIPLKALAFDRAVNVTLGLPVIRTSVDHGTAFDIVGRNLANPSSLIQAVKLAARMAKSADESLLADKA